MTDQDGTHSARGWRTRPNRSEEALPPPFYSPEAEERRRAYRDMPLLRAGSAEDEEDYLASILDENGHPRERRDPPGEQDAGVIGGRRPMTEEGEDLTREAPLRASSRRGVIGARDGGGE